MRTRAETEKRKEKKLLAEISNVDKHLKTIVEEERIRESKKELKALQKQKKPDPAALTYAEAGAIPLSDELSGSVRTIKPKGLLVVDKVNEMRERGELTARTRKRRHFDNPHGARKVVWVPKYKY